ncbi:hypothetical protein U9M48_004407 [Paspalum notatum var. saurae]|uniref:Uncharacterized protein n=1 Tax=Paspalum notatum var. saurae TaxID=547442 RepID=A0AAQ3PQ02_PASNO
MHLAPPAPIRARCPCPHPTVRSLRSAAACPSRVVDDHTHAQCLLSLAIPVILLRISWRGQLLPRCLPTFPPWPLQQLLVGMEIFDEGVHGPCNNYSLVWKSSMKVSMAPATATVPGPHVHGGAGSPDKGSLAAYQSHLAPVQGLRRCQQDGQAAGHRRHAWHLLRPIDCGVKKTVKLQAIAVKQLDPDGAQGHEEYVAGFGNHIITSE